jgi:hypothetical protein
MSPKCVYCEHEVQARCPTMYWNAEKVPCEPELVDEHSARAQVEADFQEAERRRQKEGDPDFASLLEREPEKEYLAETIANPDGTDTFTVYGPAGVVSTTTPAMKTALDSAAERIKELEGVLVAVRAKLGALSINPLAGYPAECTRVMYEVRELISLLSETLDPCKPWCVLEPGHGGGCMQAEDLADDE